MTTTTTTREAAKANELKEAAAIMKTLYTLTRDLDYASDDLGLLDDDGEAQRLFNKALSKMFAALCEIDWRIERRINQKYAK